MNTNGQATLLWTNQALLAAYDEFKIKDERAVCHCGRFTPRTFDGLCYTCHIELFRRLERPCCPPLP